MTDILEEVTEVATTHNSRLINDRLNNPHVPDNSECNLLLEELENIRSNIEKKMVIENLPQTKNNITDSIEVPGGKLEIKMETAKLTYGTIHIDFRAIMDDPDSLVSKDIRENVFLDRENFRMVVTEKSKTTTHLISKSDPYFNKLHETTPQAVERAKNLMRLYLENNGTS